MEQVETWTAPVPVGCHDNPPAGPNAFWVATPVTGPINTGAWRGRHRAIAADHYGVGTGSVRRVIQVRHMNAHGVIVQSSAWLLSIAEIHRQARRSVRP